MTDKLVELFEERAPNASASAAGAGARIRVR